MVSSILVTLGSRLCKSSEPHTAEKHMVTVLHRSEDNSCSIQLYSCHISSFMIVFHEAEVVT